MHTPFLRQVKESGEQTSLYSTLSL
ncbi:unnamed protein product [Timema podura]|uniref:Uncharacterized protein n=1 Tax=Timema podura TaxID=61482 RepID=A0ABN7PE57_TIMPD|nr:unnamed protein product [Timema podura]